MAQLPLGTDVLVAGSHPCGLWALNKPSGVRSHPNTGAVDPKALLAVGYDAKNECYRDGDQRYFLLNRLDAPTSGIVLVATEETVAHAVRKLFEARGVSKTYYALVKGAPRQPQEHWRDHLQVKNTAEGLRTTRGGNQEALCEMKLVKEGLGKGGGRMQLSLLQLLPKTGRTHQLRVQCAERQMPIVGDATYGDFTFNREMARRLGDKRLFLHAGKVKCKLEVGGEAITFVATAHLPEIFESALA
jgi:23S rRNA-/tRNA-specific pseudouridylate synthase